MDWYRGSPLLAYLESVHVASDRNLIDLRLPVQYVLRPDQGFRGYCGTLASGVIHRGEEVLVLPSRRRSRVASVRTPAGEVEEAAAPQAVTVTLEDEVDVSRGDMIVPVANVPHLDASFDAMLVWMGEEPLAAGREYLLQQTAARTGATVEELRYRIDTHDLHRRPAPHLELNEIGRVTLETARPLAFDPYVRNRGTGAFILVDRMTNATVAAGMILDRHDAEELDAPRAAPDAATNVRPGAGPSTGPDRAARFGLRPPCLWLTGLPRAGKSSLAYALEAELTARGVVAAVLDGESLRLGLSRDLGFGERDRRENVRRAAELAGLLADAGILPLVALVSPAAEDRELARRTVGDDRFFEIWCSAPLEVCEARDRDRLFARARAGEIDNVTGVQRPYEPPESPELEIPTHELDVEQAVARVVAELEDRGILPGPDVS